MTNQLSDSIMRRDAVLKATGLSKTTIYARIQNGEFPAPVPLGGRAVGWMASEIDAWIKSAKHKRGDAFKL